jgi:oxygen-independent coproporphyrinogen III oxidase
MDDLVASLVTELELRNNYLTDKNAETIYFGGGTPSLLNERQLERIFETINKFFTVSRDAEITLEANPDDLTPDYLAMLKSTPVNRLSIGIQSFFDEDLKLMNRAHDASMARRCIADAASAGFHNLTIDLMYGLPGMSLERWNTNLEQAFDLPVHHLSCYHLTIEKRTALFKMVSDGRVHETDDELSEAQFMLLMDKAGQHGFDHYEISNFARDGHYSRHNTAYWKNKPYLGIGPSAHSYNGITRQWNVSSNAAYISALSKNELPFTIEHLTVENRYNEYIMTGLRTSTGIDSELIRNQYGEKFFNDLLFQIHGFVEDGFVIREQHHYRLSRKGKHLADHITAKLMVV